MLADSSSDVSGETVQAYVTEIARQSTRRGEPRSFASIREFAQELGLQRVAAKQVVVGGTNGKGSTVAYLQQILSHQDFRVGATTSPHLHNYLERISFDGNPIDATTCLEAVRAIAHAADGIPLTYFDLTTLAALQVFKLTQVDVALVEVGLGGRLDCANVVESDVAVITNVDIDHSAVLGNTIDAISREKVGIAREGRPLVFGDDRDNHAVVDYAQTHGIPLYQRCRAFGTTDNTSLYISHEQRRRKFLIPSSINYGLESFCTGMQVASLLDHLPSQSELSSIEFSRPGGRFERIDTLGRHWILDIAHNPAATTYLRQHLALQGIVECVVVFACFADKEISAMLENLVAPLDCNGAKVVEIVITDSHGSRALRATTVHDEIPQPTCPIQFVPQLENALKIASKLATRDIPIVVLGSFDVVSRSRKVLNMRVTESSS